MCPVVIMNRFETRPDTVTVRKIESLRRQSHSAMCSAFSRGSLSVGLRVETERRGCIARISVFALRSRTNCEH